MYFGHPRRLLRTASFGLALLYAGLFTASVFILGFVVYWTVQSSMDKQLTARIDTEIDLLRSDFRSEGSDELVEQVQRRVNFIDTLEYALTDASGKTLAGNLEPTKLGWSDISFPRDGKNPGFYRVESVLLDNGYRLAVADDLGPKDEIRRAFLDALGWALLAFLILSLVGGILMSVVFLRRVDAIALTAEAIIEGDLSSRIPLRGTRDNFDRLSASLNRMLDRIQLLMESLSQVSNDIAHALRTPLGRLRQKLEAASAISGANSKTTRAIDAALNETDDILDTFSALLRIAQIESRTRTAGFREIDLSTLFQKVSEAYSAAAEDQRQSITAKIAPSLHCWGDEDLLAKMLGNLLDNAIRHTPSGSHIVISLADCGSHFVASVTDDGPGVPEMERERIFRRFYRLEQSSSKPGHGLGLALVAAVAELHGMHLTAEDNGPGLRMTMMFEPVLADAQRAARISVGKATRAEGKSLLSSGTRGHLSVENTARLSS